jgi:hypothetical protein
MIPCNAAQCVRLSALMAAQRAAFAAAIAEDKWYLSEKAQHDVGQQAAVDDFMERFFASWTNKFRIEYCKQCEHSIKDGADSVQK